MTRYEPYTTRYPLLPLKNVVIFPRNIVTLLVGRPRSIQAVEEALGELSEREQEIVRLRFGLDDGQAKTLEDVGREFGVTRERIRQIEAKTLAKLRHPQRSQRLREFLETE